MSNYEQIVARELKPGLLELDGISRETVEAHYRLYQGYVTKRNEILGKLAEADLSSANQVYSELRALKVDLTFAIGGIKNHEIYFEHLGGHGSDPDGAFGDLVRRAVAAGHGDDHLGLAPAGVFGQFRAQVLLGVVERVLHQGGIGAGQRTAQVLQVLGDRRRQDGAVVAGIEGVHGMSPSRTESTESRVARQAAAHSCSTVWPACVMR